MLPHWRLTRFRRTLFWVLVAIYVVGLPVLLLFAFGVDLRRLPGHPLEESASVTFATNPGGARVVLQDRPPQSSPAVFDDLPVGPLAFSISGPRERTWTGIVQAHAGLVSSLADLAMVPDQPARELISLDASGTPLLLDNGATVAWITPGDNGVFVGRIQRDSVAVTHVDVPGLATRSGARLEALEAAGQLVVRWDVDGAGALAVVRTSRAEEPPRSVGTVVTVPAGVLRIVSVSAEQGSVVVLETHGFFQYERTGAARPLVTFSAPLLACGFLHGRWYALDRAGRLYQLGSPLLPSSVGRVDVAAAADLPPGEVMEIVAAEGETTECWSAVRRSLFSFTVASSKELPGVDGALPSGGSGAAWIWSGDALYMSRADALPQQSALLGSRLLGVREEFLSRVTALIADDGIYLLPAVASGPSDVRLFPLLLLGSRDGARAVSCGQGTVLVRDAVTPAGATWRVLGFAP